MNMKYKKHIVNTLAFIAILVAIDQIGGRCLDALREKIYSRHPQADKTWYLAKAVDADMVIIGSSGATGNYDANKISKALGMSVFNGGISGHTADYQCALIRLMLQHHKPKYILWELDDVAFSDLFSDMDYNGTIDIYPYYGNDFVKKYIDRKDGWQKFRMMSRLYRHNSKIMNYLSVAFNHTQDSLNGYEPLPAEGYQYPELKEPTGSNAVYDASFNPARAERIQQTLDFCREQGVKVVITNAPYLTKAPVRASLCHKTLVEMAQRNDIPYMDFMQMEEFNADPTLFHDTDHLNCHGTEKYMSIFIPAMRQAIDEGRRD